MGRIVSRAGFASALAVALVVGALAGSSSGSAGDPLLIGRSNSAGSSNSSLTANTGGNSFVLYQNGTGSALRGWAKGSGNGVSATASNMAGNGVLADNEAANFGAGTAVRAEGGQQAGVYANTFDGPNAAGVIGDDLSGSTVGSGVVGFTDVGAAVVGEAFSNASPGGFGGFFLTESPGGQGLEVEACSAIAPAPPGCGTTQLAATFKGNVSIEGSLTVSGAKTGYVADYAVNGTSVTIHRGDALTVLGARAPLIGNIPLLVVGPARAGQIVIGVADSEMVGQQVSTRSLAGTRSAGVAEVPPVRISQETAYRQGGPATAPGHYLLVATLGAFGFASVDASGGPITAGDSLTASGTAGRLTHARPLTLQGQTFYAPGTSVGYALGSLGKGTGVIAIFVEPH